MKLALWRLALIAGLVAALEAMCRLKIIKPVTMIPPSEMVAALWKLLASGKANADIVQTLSCVAGALVLSVTVGFVAGVAIQAAPRLRRTLDPFLASYYAVPFFVFYPVLIALFGLTKLPVIVIAFAFAVVAMIINTLNGLDRVPRVLTKVARAHNMGAIETAFRLKLPAAAPNLFTGLKLAVAYSFIGVIASEFIMAASGLGYSIAYAYNEFDNRSMYALMLFVLVLVTSVNMALHVWEQRIMRRRTGR